MSRDLKAIVDELAAGKKWARPGYDGKPSREIAASVVLGPAKGDDGSTVELELSVNHDKDRKQFYGSIHISTVRDEGGYLTRSYHLMDKTTGGRLEHAPALRYSAKALEAFWELQIGKLQDDPSILERLNLDHNQDVAA